MYKLLSFITFVLCYSIGHGQVKGTGDYVTKSFTLEDITSIYVGLYADVQIDCASESFLEISTEENLFEHIGMKIENGVLTLDQINWVQARQKISIKIGAPYLQYIIQSTHDRTHVKNISMDHFSAKAEVGSIVLEGNSNRLIASAELGEIDARQMESQEVEVTINGRGSVLLGTAKYIHGAINDGGTVIYDDADTLMELTLDSNSNLVKRGQEQEKIVSDTRYINLKIKNNSWKRINAYVVGPKPDGKKFSYGFPMRPGQVRDERWTTGSKIYRQTAMGTKKLLVEITEKDEDQVVKLHATDNN